MENRNPPEHHGEKVNAGSKGVGRSNLNHYQLRFANRLSLITDYWLPTSVLNAYGQLFFTKNKTAAVLVLLASFIDPDLGLWGLLGALLANGIARVLGFDRTVIAEGLYALNGMLVSLAVAAAFDLNGQYLLVFVAVVALSVLLTVASMNLMARVGLPALSLPALLALWTFYSAVPQYKALVLDEGDIFLPNKLYGLGGMPLVEFHERLVNFPLPGPVAMYFKSLSSILFQDNLITGLVISIALLISSRIAFTLSIIGFATGFGFYHLLQADITQLEYTHIGFNFILTSIAIGGFFFIPSWQTYLLTVAISPMIVLLIGAATTLLHPFHLPVFSLPFILTVITLLYVMNFSFAKHGILKVVHQQYSPERNLYAFRNYRERFGKNVWVHLALPFFGEWRVSQGHDGKITHKGEWNHAWDFDLADNEGKTYRMPGTAVENYYCYNLPVTAPADGYVVFLTDNVEDNKVGDANLKDNWGNSLVIKHAEHLYTNLSHLKAGSFKVAVGDYVRKGDILATLGNSGRSPEPHLHYQVQATPYIGSKTLSYPLSYYLVRNGHQLDLRTWSIPQEEEVVQNIKTLPLLTETLRFIPGQELECAAEDGKVYTWDIFSNAYNTQYIWCRETKSAAYFANDGVMFYFTHFYGNRDSHLFAFYIGMYRILQGYYPQTQVEDALPLYELRTGIRRWPQDFIAPFVVLSQAKYKSVAKEIDDAMRPSSICIQSQVSVKTASLDFKEWEFELRIKEKKLEQFSYVRNGKSTVVTVKQS